MQVGSGFAVSGYYGSKVRGYFYLGLDYVGNAWEESFSQDGLWALSQWVPTLIIVGKHLTDITIHSLYCGIKSHIQEVLRSRYRGYVTGWTIRCSNLGRWKTFSPKLSE